MSSQRPSSFITGCAFRVFKFFPLFYTTNTVCKITQIKSPEKRIQRKPGYIQVKIYWFAISVNDILNLPPLGITLSPSMVILLVLSSIPIKKKETNFMRTLKHLFTSGSPKLRLPFSFKMFKLTYLEQNINDKTFVKMFFLH